MDGEPRASQIDRRKLILGATAGALVSFAARVALERR